jgi:penicillin-binding protein
MIDKITDSSGKVIYQHKAAPVRVFSKQTNYLMQDMMRDVFTYGTGASLRGMLQFNSDLIGKTGTSQDWRDGWLVASNPNITMGVWIGYAHNQQLNRTTYSTQSKQLWAGFANRAYNVDPDLMAPKQRFKQPKGIVKQTYCGLTDGKPTEYCKAAGFEVNDLMNQKYASTEAIEALEPFTEQQKSEEQPIQGDQNQQQEEPIDATGLFKFKPDFLNSHFPYTDLSSAKPELLGKIRP